MKKRIGILTFHRAINWGAMLQCYALYKTIEKLGYKVDVIDYRQPHIEHQYQYVHKATTFKELKNILLKPRWWFGFIFKTLPARILRKHTCLKLIKNLTYSNKVTTLSDFPQQYETIVIGSDQVWANYCTNGIDEMYYGNFPHSKSKIIGYAISSNIESLKENSKEKLKTLCKNFSSIAFREEEISNYLQESNGLKSEIVLDPTLLLDNKEWDNIIGESSKDEAKDYVLTYFLNENFDKEILNRGIQSFANHNDCKIIQLGEVVKSPENFINLIKNAKYIITSSFHVTVFSLIYNKQVWALRTNNGKDIRYINLLEKVGLKSQLIEYQNIDKISIQGIDYRNVHQILAKEQEISIQYLKNNL